MYPIYKRKKLATLLTAVFLSTGVSISVNGATGTNVNTPTLSEILDAYETFQIEAAIEHQDTFVTVPSLSVPYEVGSLSSESLAHGINTLNYLRFIAGIDETLSLRSSYTTSAQAAALGNAINNVVTHFPTQPSDMTSAFYDMISSSARVSSMAYLSGDSTNAQNLYHFITTQWMQDSDTQNIDRMAHRRWILNPSMSQTGFGLASNLSGTYGGMYYADGMGESTSVTGVAWPAQLMPVDLFQTDTPWTFTVGQEVGPVTVTLTRESDGKQWVFQANDSDKEGHFFIIENSSYGQTGCIVFRPDPSTISYNDGDVFHVTIDGATSAQYTVTFFDINKSLSADSDIPSLEDNTSNNNSENNTSTDLENQDIIPTIPSEIPETNDENVTFDDNSTDNDEENKDKNPSENNTNPNNSDDNNTSDNDSDSDTSHSTNQDTDDEDASLNDNTNTEDSDLATNAPDTQTFSLNFTSITVKQGNTLTLSVVGAEPLELQWHSSDSTVATVDELGELTAQSGGYTEITATDSSGVTQICEVFVSTDIQSLEEPLENDFDLLDMNFIDVQPTDWFYTMVEITFQQGFMSGVSETEFEPYTPASRGMITTILYSFAGKPDDIGENFFDDVSSSDYFASPISWAKNQGIVLGVSETEFYPNDAITREQLATILYNYHKIIANHTPVTTNSSTFTDNDRIEIWAVDGVNWCQEQGLMTGRDDGSFDPQATATRAEIATILSQYYSK